MAKGKWDPLLCDALIEHMSQGLSFESFVAIANVHRSMLYQWLDRHKDFKNAYELGHAKGRLYWEVMGINGCAGRVDGFSAAVWIFTMKCRFGYRDGTETGEQADAKPVKDVVYKTTWRQIEKKPESADGEEKK